MKKIARVSVLSVLVLTAMAFSAFNVMAMTPGSDNGSVDSSTVTAGPKQEVTGTEPASIDPVGTVEPIGTETVSPDKSNVNDPKSTVEPVHTEVISPDKGPLTDSSPDKNNVGSTTSDKSNSSPDKNSADAGQASGHDNSSGPSHPESVDTSSAPAGNTQ